MAHLDIFQLFILTERKNMLQVSSTNQPPPAPSPAPSLQNVIDKWARPEAGETRHTFGFLLISTFGCSRWGRWVRPSIGRIFDP